ncbi:MAG: tRNA preQ1(34) S-adenosylmethionine ribosyltransferase-isomerase QueA [Deltaproteobacteria bacterium]|nr:tRNA preQ1(34) S-adenosylmethionine ribosyltransferase-isomerase QueA [Deltaproteobacteria bacterium]
MRVDALDYALPPALIAREPTPERDGARLLVLPRATGALTHGAVRDLSRWVPEGSLVVVNDTRVIPARLHGTRASGGRVEVFLLRALDDTRRRWLALGRASKPLRPDTTVTVSPALAVKILGRTDEGLLVELQCADPDQALARDGEVPLPPYLRRAPTEADRVRYQTVYARVPGAVAAPTAGLHLTPEGLEALRRRGCALCAVTLHVGAGTFAPVTVEDLDLHPMHREWYEVPEETARAVDQARREGRRVLAVGTTAVRALESFAATGEPRGDTRLLLQPGSAFRVVDALMTNFHLPRSTLLALVMALAGVDRVREAYREAIARGYRFFSYGDAMLIV